MEPKLPKIDVDELMERLREEALTRSLASSRQNGSGAGSPNAPLPAMAARHELSLKNEQLAHRIECARVATRAAHIPKVFRRFLRDQGQYNSLLIETVSILKDAAGELIIALEKTEQSFQNQIDVVLEYVQYRHGALDTAAKQLEGIAQHLSNLQGQADNQGQHLKNLQKMTNALVDRLGNWEDARKVALRVDERQTADSTFLKSELHLLHRRLTELRPAPPARKKSETSSAGTAASSVKHDFDAFYLAFENRFRGNRELIKERLRIYLKEICGASLGGSDSSILDVGCGRGEWLELLREQGLTAEGVDLNTIMVAECKNRNLSVREADALEYLRSLPAGSRGVITGFHLIEHLEFPVLVELLRESLRVLCPRGLVIFETPNPDNVLVGSNRFYTDPTHGHPLPMEYTVFLAETVGFTGLVARPLHPDDHTPINDVSAPELSKFINKVFFGEQDYALIAQKPTT